MLLVESSLISEGSYMPKDNQESELIKSFRWLSEEQKSEIQKSLDSKLDK